MDEETVQEITKIDLSRYKSRKKKAQVNGVQVLGGIPRSRNNIYILQDPETGRILFLKCQYAERIPSEPDIQEEIARIQSLSHPNLPEVLYFGERWFVTPRAGKDLIAWLNQVPNRKPEEYLEVVQKAAEVLAYLHSRKLIHADPNPHNFLVDGKKEARRVNITDLERSFIEGPCPHFEEGVIKGAPRFLAPEQITQAYNPNYPFTTRMDIFPLGVILYELFEDRSPWEKQNRGRYSNMNIFERITDSQPLPPRNASRFAVGLADLILAMLEKNPPNRPTSTEVVKALDEII